MPRPGNRACSSLLADRDLSEPSHEFAGSAFTEQDREFLLPLFERILRTRCQLGTRMISKPFDLYRAQNPNRQTMGNMMGMPSSTSGRSKIIPVIWTEWRVQASLIQDWSGCRDFTHDPNPQPQEKNNPVLWEKCNGKTALALVWPRQSLVAMYQLKSAGACSELDLMNVVAGTRLRGDFEERMNNIIQTSKKTVT